MPFRRLLAALDARLELHLPSGNRVVIARSDAAIAVFAALTSNANNATRSGASSSSRRLHSRSPGQHDGSASRSSLDRDEILRLYDAGHPITQIAERAGISRQRVHAMAKSAGRTLRRAVVAQQRTREAELLLS